LLSSDFDGLAM